MSTFNLTTGPISSSLGLNNIRVVVLNNTSIIREARIRLFDLDVFPKLKVIDKTISLDPWSTTTIDTPVTNLSKWEVRFTTHSRNVRIWVGGRDDAGMNLIGNTILDSELVRV